MDRIASGVNRLLLHESPIWRHSQTLFGIIWLLAGGKCWMFHQVLEWYCLHRYLCFHCMFCLWDFVLLFCTNKMAITYLNCIHSNSTLRLIHSTQTSYDCIVIWRCWDETSQLSFECWVEEPRATGSKVKVEVGTVFKNLVDMIRTTEQFQTNHTTLHVSCTWWNEEPYLLWVKGSKVKLQFALCILNLVGPIWITVFVQYIQTSRISCEWFTWLRG